MIHSRSPSAQESHFQPYRPQQWLSPPSTRPLNYPPPADYPFSFSLPEPPFNLSARPDIHMSRNAVPQAQPFYDARSPATPVQMSTANVPIASTRMFTTGPYLRDQGFTTSSVVLNSEAEQFQPESGLFAALGNAEGISSAYVESNPPVEGHSDFTDALSGTGPSSASFNGNTSGMYATEAVAAATFAPSHDIAANLQSDYPPIVNHYSSDIALSQQYLRDLQDGTQSVGMPENPLETLPESAIWPEGGWLEWPNAGL
ncbi:hypothetical protein C8Q73DRAFT_679054 [Cubamyces lactineus]|nr:hypothetical protein C8Q73DRAFT_679054 [Cubamyces lactineus]